MDKSELRQIIRKEKAKHNSEELQAWSQDVLRRLESLPAFVHSQTLLLYYSLPDEVDTHAFIQKWASTKLILLPKVVGADLTLHLYSGDDCLQEGLWGIREPNNAPFEDFPVIDMAVIPGVAFTQDGKRLGRGKGYYDKLLSKLSSHTVRLGIAFPFQVVENIPCDQWDVQMNQILF